MIVSRRSAMLALAAGTGAVATGCASQDDPPAATPTKTKKAPSDLDGRAIDPEPDNPSQEGGPVPSAATDEDEQDAIDAARATMDVWVQGSTLTQMEWQDALQDTLTPAAQDAYANRFGYKVPDTKVTEDPAVIRASVGSAVLRVTTDATTYEVTVIKTDDTWKTSGISPLTGATDE